MIKDTSKALCLFYSAFPCLLPLSPKIAAVAPDILFILKTGRRRLIVSLSAQKTKKVIIGHRGSLSRKESICYNTSSVSSGNYILHVILTDSLPLSNSFTV